METTKGYHRFPTVHGDRVVFVCEDDLFTVPLTGGPARRLSANPGVPSRPVLSPDGSLLAFASRDEGHDEVYVMPSEGGPATRLTWLGAMTFCAGWRRDGSAVLLASDAGQPFMAWYHLHEVAPSGGPTRPLDLGPAMSVSGEPDGRGVVLGRNTGDPARWKRYRGGTAGTLWIDRTGKGDFRSLIDLPGNLAAPMWIGDRIFFLSDHEGNGDLFSCAPDGSDLSRHTDHRDFYVRFPQTDGHHIVYSAGADLYRFEVETGEYSRIPAEVRSARPQRARRFVDAARHMESCALHPAGHSVAVTTRGKLYSFPLFEGAVTPHGEPDGVRYRLAQWLPDGERIIAVTDESGEEEIAILGPGTKRRPLRLTMDIGRAVELVVSPFGPDRVAITNHRYEILLVDIEKGKARVVDRSPCERVEGPAFSADGRWLAYSLADSFTTRGIRICEAATGKVRPATRPEFRDFSPCFGPEGDHLYFLSYREYDPVYDHHAFDLGFPRGGRLMCLPLRADLPSPFEPKPRAPGAPAAEPPKAPEKKDGKRDGKPKPAAVKIDFDGLADRVLAFPVPEGTFRQIAALKGKVLFTSFPVEGSLAQPFPPGDPAPNGTLESYDLCELRRDTLLSGMSDFGLSADGKAMVVRCGRRLRALAAGAKPEAGSEQKEPGRESGWIDLGRLRVSVRPPEEWAQMLREAWRLMRDHFWRPDMAGVDWPKVYERYRPLLDRVATRSEFSDLLWEFQGEMGTSHAYELGGDYRPEPSWHIGLLGADLGFDERAGAWKVVRLPKGDSWRGDAASPLSAPGLRLAPGARLLAIAGRKLDRRTPPGAALVHLAGQRVTLEFRNPGAGPARTATIATLSNERALRYRDWVQGNREFVHAKTKGRAGYVHIPDMGPRGYAEFHRGFLAELKHEALVIDVRFNGGGHVSQLLLEKLLRRRVAWDTQRWGSPVPYPSESPAGPLVALTNERAGSDGDIFSHAFKLYGLGPLIGTRTWGGVVGIWPRHALVDGTVTTQPEFSFWFPDVGFGVENYGTDPDILVEILPQDYRRGKDPQLARGVEEILRLLAEKPPAPPPAVPE
ncbi:MAG: S41 family peptidase [Planctomycetes bacterium]|jgi:tricorn protease|nr:S41 family peptidase [Planctomycetota bacterium]